MKRDFSLPVLLLALCTASMFLQAAEPAPLYVATDGNDAWSGQLAEPKKDRSDGPFRTLKKAAESLQPGQCCFIRQGIYRETLKPARSGEPDRPITFQNYQNEVAVLSGADPLTGWTTAEGQIQKAPMDWDLADQNQLFVGETMMTEARWPNNHGTLLQPDRAVAESGAADTLTDSKLSGDENSWKDAMIWCAGGSRWICWSEKVTGFDAKSKTITFDKPQAGDWYKVRKGNPYVLMGLRSALDDEGEWWYDRANHQMLLWPPKGADLKSIEAKRRLHCIDLSGCSQIRIVGLRFRAGGLLTDEKSSHLLLSGCTGQYVAHSYLKDVGGKSGVLIRGQENEVTGCELAWSSTAVLEVEGTGHRIVNCFVHDGDYGGKWKGTVSLTGRKILFSHNTVRHSGRDLVSIHGLMESLIQYNDLSDAGWLTSDLGMTYGHTTDFMNTVIRYNLVHDNHAENCAMGIYFDHLSHNVIVHHNIIYNAPFDPLRLNNPSYFDLIYNNSCFNTGTVGTFDHSKRNDLFSLHYANNLFNKPPKLPAHVFLDHNLVSADPGYESAADHRFALKPDSAALKAGIGLEGVTDPAAGATPDIGAIQSGQGMWKVGHDFAHPPSPKWEAPDIAWMNLVRNSCFELPTLEGWSTVGAGEAKLVPGNGWGNGYGKGKVEKTGTQHRELRLTKGAVGVEQVIDGLYPKTDYTLSGWLKVSDEKTSVRLGVRHPDGKEVVESVGATEWTRVLIEFSTGPDQTKVTLFAMKESGEGTASVDNLALPKSPRGYMKPAVKSEK